MIIKRGASTHGDRGGARYLLRVHFFVSSALSVFHSATREMIRLAFFKASHLMYSDAKFNTNTSHQNRCCNKTKEMTYAYLDFFLIYNNL